MSVGGFLSAPDARAEAPLARPATADGHVKAFPCIVSGFTRISGRNGTRLALQHGKRALDPPRRERPGGVAPLRFASRDDVDRKRLGPAGGSLWHIRLERYVRSRLLEIYADHPQGTSPEEQFVRVRQRIRAHRPSTLVIDPISAAIRMGGQSTVLGVAERLLAMAKSEGKTTLWTRDRKSTRLNSSHGYISY